MNEEALNLSIRKFLKKVGITSQREIEQAVRKALEQGRAGEAAGFPVRMTLEMPDLGVSLEIDGEIELRRDESPSR